MTSIAQRRVAGATALMILLYLLQVALYTPTASADHAAPYTSGNPSSECGWEGEGSIPSNLFRKYQYSGSFSSPEGTADVTVALSDGGFTYQNNEMSLEIYRIILKVGQGVGTDEVLGDHNLPQAGELSIPSGLSHVTFCLVEFDPFDVGPCDTETGTRDVTFTVPPNHDLTITDSTNAKVGDYAAGTHTEALESGTYNWFLYSPPTSGQEVEKGTFVVGECEKETTTTTEATTTTTTQPTTTTTTQPTTTTTQPTTTTTTQPTTTTTQPTTTTLASTSVNFDAFCDDAGNFVGAFSLPNASGSLDINGDGVFGAGETNLASGTYVLTGETYSWQATADAGFTLTGLSSGSGETELCAEVLGTTITTAPAEVSADTLPFTGFESGDTVKLGLLALLAGVLMLFAVRGPKEEEAAATDIGGWTSL